jgi:hypothetical protein
MFPMIIIGFIVIAALVLLILIVLLAPKIRSRMGEKTPAISGEAPRFDCAPAGKVKGANGLSEDVYDCVEQRK